MRELTPGELETAEKKGIFKRDEKIIVRSTCFKILKVGKGQMTLKVLREETRDYRREHRDVIG